MADVKTDYPARYYVQSDSTGYITHWYDTWDMGNIESVPPAASLLAVTEDQWNDPTVHAALGVGVKNGAIVAMTYVVPLATQAKEEMSWINQQASLASSMGETFTDAMRSYVKAIQAIANGSDTTSTALPARPDVIMV
ncbi:hypothetical protein HKD24_04115 [Gluconobacter sp. LMG 31484]|uniref:Uncharacterized protein n=1 Tax=Gluconobacter vitians TaxID=2728102 RepID=A0ABR9Y3V2_9PROT|nr:hypothetical protein [Gluconobacter vitians]MBF0858401.1 hypothetical protein [Gluconobacter vitians]